MQVASSNTSFSQRLHRLAASARFFSLSLLMHIVIIIFGGSAVIIQKMVEAPDFIAAGDGELVAGSEVTHTIDVPPAFSAPEPTPTVPTPAGASSQGIDALASVSLINNAFPIGTVPDGKIQMGKAAGKGTDDVMAKAIANTMEKTAAGMGRVGGKSMVKFFGKMTEVQAVVFVVDISGSMVQGKKSAKTYEDLEDEVKRVIRGLDQKTMFGLVAFSGDAHLYKDELVAATNDEKQRAMRWLKKQSPVGWDKTEDPEEKRKHQGTRADKGLEAAFKLKADTIFFVSDGEPTGTPPTKVLEMLSDWQKGRPKPAVINAVAYLADSGQKFMEDLAAKTAGSFREINPRDARNK